MPCRTFVWGTETKVPPGQTVQADELLAGFTFLCSLLSSPSPCSIRAGIPRKQTWYWGMPCKAPHSTSQQLSLDSFWHCPSIKFNRIFPLIGKNSSGSEPFAEWEGKPASWQSSAPSISSELLAWKSLGQTASLCREQSWWKQAARSPKDFSYRRAGGRRGSVLTGYSFVGKWRILSKLYLPQSLLLKYQ